MDLGTLSWVLLYAHRGAHHYSETVNDSWKNFNILTDNSRSGYVSSQFYVCCGHFHFFWTYLMIKLQCP